MGVLVVIIYPLRPSQKFRRKMTFQMVLEKRCNFPVTKHFSPSKFGRTISDKFIKILLFSPQNAGENFNFNGISEIELTFPRKLEKVFIKLKKFGGNVR